jgi:uncharacterized membrane protein
MVPRCLHIAVLSDWLADGRGVLPGDVERHLSETHAVQWTVILIATVFDITTTIVGVGQGVDEGNAVARAFIETYGTPGLGLLKFAALVTVLVLWAALPDRYGTAILSGFALISLFVVALNAITLAGL